MIKHFFLVLKIIEITYQIIINSQFKTSKLLICIFKTVLEDPKLTKLDKNDAKGLI